MIVLIDTKDGRHFETYVLATHNGKGVTLMSLIENIAEYGTIKVTSEGIDHQIPLEEIKRIGFSTDPADGVRQ